MSEAIKPCPFCGSGDIRFSEHPWAGRGMHRDQTVYSMCCYKCGATFPNRYRRELLVERWNARTTPASGHPAEQGGLPPSVTAQDDEVELFDKSRRVRTPVSIRSAVPDGWKLVPIEPDDAMLDAGNDVINDGKEWGRQVSAADVFSAMLAATPIPEPVAEQDGLREALRKRCYTTSEPHLSVARVTISFNTLKEASDAQIAISKCPQGETAAPTPPASWRTMESAPRDGTLECSDRIAGWLQYAYGNVSSVTADKVNVFLKERAAALAAPAPPSLTGDV